MMDMHVIKARIERNLYSMARRCPLAPNQITLLSLLAMSVAAYLILKNDMVAAGLMIALSGFLDVFDGTVAKAKKQESKFGAFLDRMADRASDFIMLSSLVLAGYVGFELGLFIICCVFLASYASSCMEAATKGNMGEKLSMRGVRLAILSIASIFGFLPTAMIIIAIIGAYSLAERMAIAYRIMK